MGSLLFFFSLCSLLHLGFSQQPTNSSEIAALKAISEHWNVSIWDESKDPCMPNAPWAAEDANPRVECDCSGSGAGSCHVTHLKIYALDVFGEMPPELFQLTELMDLNLGQNVLNGRIPKDIGKLSKMEYLSLGINNFSGPVPAELGNLSQLISLSFSSNRFSGPLPKELGKLTSLQQLYIDSSGVSGEIPHELENLKNLKILWASDNLFTGKLPEFIGRLEKLTDLRMQGTALGGPIPSSFSALTNLEDLRIGDITGQDSSIMFLKNMTKLNILSLRNSQVSGELPVELGTFTKLQYLDLSFNKLTGRIPSSFQNLENLQFLYLGNNNLTGDLPSRIVTSKLIALDVSFNPLSGSLPLDRANSRLSINVLGTSMYTPSLNNRQNLMISQCLQKGAFSCTNKGLSFQDSPPSINCGGKELVSSSGINFNDDSEALGAASFYGSNGGQWAVSNTGFYLSNPSAPSSTATTGSQILGTLDSELYKTARISPSSLRYYILGLDNGKYTLDLHFAEIVMADSLSWKGLGRRLFDIYIQGERVVRDFNIKDEANGSNTAVVKTFQVNVTNSIMDLHFFWAGRGTCCIPLQATYGPLVSAIQVSRDSTDAKRTSKHGGRRIAVIAVTVIASTAGLVILLSIAYLWWKKKAVGNSSSPTDSPRKTLV